MKQLGSMPTGRKYLGVKEETLICTVCRNSWSRISRRGRKPTLCPVCVSKAEEAKAEERRISLLSPDPEAGDRMALARAGKAQRQRERSKREQEEDRQRKERMARTLPNTNLLWQRAFEIALRENTVEAWNKCDTLMNSYVNAKRAIGG
jgi:hypothetical protein